MAKEDPIIEISGLQLSNNTFSASPPGSLTRADELVMPQKGVAEPRRGQEYADTLPAATSLPFGMTEFDGKVLVSYATSKTSTSYGLGYVDGSALSVYSGAPFNPVDDDGVSTAYGRLKFGFAGGYLHFCTTSGPKALEAYNGTPRAAGLTRMPDPGAIVTSASVLGATGVGLEYGYSRAYRTVLRKPTSGGYSLLSPPSGRVVVQNQIFVAAGSLVRAANVVTVTTVPQSAGTTDSGVNVGDAFDLVAVDAVDPNFPEAAEVVASEGTNFFTYADVAGDATSVEPYYIDTGPRPVVITALLSSDATTTTPVRFYRSRDTVATVPLDEMFLVAEVFPSGADITAGYVQFVDVTPQSVTDDPLYSNPQTGSEDPQPNDAPPLYRDTANFAERQWYAQITGLQSLEIQMLGVGAPDGIQNNDTITIAGVTFTFKNSASVGNFTEVQIYSDGLYTANVQRTCQALILSIVLYLESQNIDVRAYYLSSQTGSPGRILLQAIAADEAVFAVRASRPASWTPALKSASDTNSVAEYAPSTLMYAKLGQPEAVPLLNTLPVGSKNYPIARILALQNALLVFKQGDGIYSVTGSAPFQVLQISTANILAVDCACVCADAAWVYTDQGILRVSDSGGATVVSRPIETALQALLARYPDETQDYSFAVPYETERRVLFFVPFELDGATPVLRAWCYNNATQSWTGPLYTYAFGGTVSSTDSGFLDKRLYLGVYDDAFATTRITKERNGNAPEYLNYVDGVIVTSITVVAQDSQGVTVVRLASTTGVETGDLLGQGTNYLTPIVMRPDLGPTWVEPLEEIPWTVDVVGVAKHYDVTVQFQPQGNPSARKTLTRLAWLFKPEWFCSPSAQTLLATDQIQADLEIATPFKGFGSNPFGSAPFGDPTPLVVDVNPIAAKWANAAQFFPGFTMPVACSKLKLQGFVLRLETQDAPVGRGK